MSASRLGGRHATTIVLVVLAGAAASWLFVAEKNRVTTEERQARHGRLFSAWRADDVTRIAIVSSRASFSVVRDHPEDRDSHSFTVESSEGSSAADPTSVDQLLSSLDLATSRRDVPAASVDRSRMGLDAPRARIDVTMGDLVARLAIGNEVAAGDGAYAEVDGEHVVVVAPALVLAIDLGPDSFRDKKLVPYAAPDLVKIAIDGAESDAGRYERATWPGSRGTSFRVEGNGPRVDARLFRNVVEGLGSLEAEVLLAAEPDEKEAKVVLRLTPKSGPDAVIALGAPCPEHPDLRIAARRAPSRLVGCVAPTVLAPFLRSAADLPDLHLFGASRDELVEVKIDRGGEMLEMARRGTGFFVRKPEETSVPDVAARGLLDALIDAAGVLAPVDDKELVGEGSATIRVISRPVSEDDQERIETVRIGPPVADGPRAVRREEDGAGIRVPEDAIRPLLVGTLVLRDRKIIDVAAEKVREVAVVEGTASQRVRRVGNTVELVEPRGPGLVADEQWGLELCDRLAQLEAMRWLSASDDGSFGLSPPRATLEIHVEDQLGKPETERTLRIALGARSDDGTFAQIVGAPEVFLAPPEIETAAMRPLVDRGAFTVRAEDVKKLVVRAGSGKAFELERKMNALLAADPGEGDKSAVSRAARIRDALDDLVALTAVAVGPPRKEAGLDAPVLTLDVTPNEGRPFRVLIGAADVLDGAAMYYARRSDVGATFAIAPSGVRALLEALR